MNVYDFDGTIYRGDSTIDFYLWELKRHPIILKVLFKQISAMIKYKLKFIDKTEMKSEFFSFLQIIKDVDSDVIFFWKENEQKIEKWYINQKKSDDVIISASPQFLLEPICSKLSISNLMATNVDKMSGKIYGKNCRGEEKVKRFRERYENIGVQKFYSDSRSDDPMANIAEKAYFVKKGKIVSWS